mmetsp:Transcript_18026/g.50077  ORF Transcript_18026/g.50077 Transcript_18026/m.50077 type:complete len:558 (-) Transcript_18026:272-1945(-)
MARVEQEVQVPQAEDAAVAIAPEEETPEESSSVGVLGWLGFVILNIAAWGIIGVSSALAWPLGFSVCLVYTGLLMGMATCLPRYGDQYKSFENLLWVLGCIFVFVLGLYLSINVVCPQADTGSCPSTGGGSSGVDFGQIDNDLKKLLPNASSSTLQDWAAIDMFYDKNGASFVDFAGYTVFSGSNASQGERFLLRSDGSTTNQVVMPVLTNPTNFMSFGSNAYFIAVSSDVTPGLYSFTPTGVAQGTASLVKAFNTSKWINVWGLTADNGSMFFKVGEPCSGGFVNSVVRSDGTPEGTVDLRGIDRCANFVFIGNPTTEDPGIVPTGSTKPSVTFWSIIFLGVVPMMLLASFILIRKKCPGMFLNLFYGFGLAVILVYIIAENDEGESVFTFLKWFITIYTSFAYLAISLASLLVHPLPKLVEEMKDWIMVFAGVPFFVMMHIDLEIPVTDDAWRWILYNVVIVVQMLISIIVGRTLPMVLGALCTFVTSWKISYEIVVAIFGDNNMGSFEVLVLLGFMALQGISIIVGAIVYASKRAKIEDVVRGSLLRCLGKQSA